MARDGLFRDLAQQHVPERGVPGGRARMRVPVRDQLEWRMADLDSLIAHDHPARLIWAYVEALDLSAIEDRIKAREGRPGQPPPSPALMMALWLYATSQGVGSARELDRLCTSDDAYRWLCGGVSMNYHTLSDFRVAHPEVLERLLIENVAALAQAGLIDLDTLAQDGMRVRASAGASSFRRRQTLEQHLAKATALVDELKRELRQDAGASTRRRQAAAAREGAAP